MKESLGEAEELDGFEELNDEDKARITKAWEEGHVDSADVPETQDPMIAMTEEEEKELKKQQRLEKAKAKRPFRRSRRNLSGRALFRGAGRCTRA